MDCVVEDRQSSKATVHEAPETASGDEQNRQNERRLRSQMAAFGEFMSMGLELPLQKSHCSKSSCQRFTNYMTPSNSQPYRIRFSSRLEKTSKYDALAQYILFLSVKSSRRVWKINDCQVQECGSLIGKGGCKIKEIQESTGAQVQVAGDMLPNSTERAITIAGIPQSIIECVKQICMIMLETLSHPPFKGHDHPIPKPSSSPVIFAGGQERYSTGSNSASFPHTTPSMCLTPDLEGPPVEAYAIQGQYAIPQPDLTKLHQLAMQQSHVPMTHGNTRFSGIESSSPEVKGYWAGLDASVQTTSHEFTIPNNLIGCIIGHQDTKINEIHQMSWAQIKIANPVEGSTDRQVTITASAASVSLAQYLINVRLSSETGGMGSS
ncbi:LOW QUALITY PROTEIN: poly(rC)-binding protein 2-like [Octodon degus]|uniref:LOW QUALITY PROTEIN: poly(RC)-binding protein 2-like n=1 Tax=Octodon degus TaxID=10160 RepID=A0A6P6E4R5_OCTDE|nr:LOW QUALITY PROTEIN: poly(rC)-binding protein 2-like [Octodon degus]